MRLNEIIPTLLGNQEVKTDCIDQYTYDENGKLKNKLTTVGLTFINRDITYDEEGRVKEEYEVSYEGHGMKRKNLGVEKTQYYYNSTDTYDETKITTFVKIFAEGTDQFRLARINNEILYKEGSRTVIQECYNKDEKLVASYHKNYDKDDELILLHEENYNSETLELMSETVGKPDSEDPSKFVTTTTEKSGGLETVVEKVHTKSEVEGFQNVHSTFKNVNGVGGYQDEKYEYIDGGFIKSTSSNTYINPNDTRTLEFVNIYKRNKNNKLILFGKEFYCTETPPDPNTYQEWKSENYMTATGDISVVIAPNDIYVSSPDGSYERYEEDASSYYTNIRGYDLEYHFEDEDKETGHIDLRFLGGKLTSFNLVDEDEFLVYLVRGKFNNRDYIITVEEYDKATNNVMKRVNVSIPKTRKSGKELFYDIASIAREMIEYKYRTYRYGIDFDHMSPASILLNTYFRNVKEIFSHKEE